MPKEQEENALGTERVGKLIVKYSVPGVISMVVVALYNIVDQIFIGQSVGYVGNAATNIILPLTTLVIGLGGMLGDGASAHLSLQLGMGNEKKAAKGVGNCITNAVAIGVLVFLLCEVFLTPLCKLFGSTDATLQYAIDYGRIIVIGFPFSMIDGAMTAVIRADGRPRQSMYGMVLGCGSNIVLDALFCLVFGWGVKGAAVATIIGEGLNAIYYVYLLFSLKSVRLKKEYFKPEGKMTRKVMGLGFPSFLTQIAIVITIFVMNNVIVAVGAGTKYGSEIPLAVMGITMKLCAVAINISLGIATGTQPVWGFNYGKGQYGRVKQAFVTALLASTAAMVVMFLVFELFPKQLIGLFGSESDLYVEFAVKCIRHFLAGSFMIGAGVTCGIFFQALGRPVHSTVLTFLRQILILIPAILILGFTVGMDGLLWAGAISDAGSGVIALITVAVCWKGLFKKEPKAEKTEEKETADSSSASA